MKSASFALFLSVSILAAGCGGGGPGDLDQDVVTHLPDGTATGSAASGTYTTDLYIKACNGNCPLIQGSITTCDVGAKSTATLTVVQTGGHLQIDSNDLIVTRMTGGLFADGSFDVGGYGTQLSGSLEMTVRVQGSIHSDGSATATSRSRGVGSAYGTSVNCTATYDVTGKKQ